MVEASDYSLLACAVAGRRVAVHFAQNGELLSYSDGHAIMLPAASETAPLDWFPVVVQASLIGAESLHPAALRKLVGRREAARRYAFFEALRAAQLLSPRLPSSYVAALSHASKEVSSSPSQSLEWAVDLRKSVEIPDFIGTVRPLSALRKLVSEEGFSAATASQAEGKFEKKDVEEFDDDDDTEESAILKLFQNPFSGSNPMADMLNKLLGAGTSKGSQDSSSGDGGDEMPVGRFEQAMRKGVNAVLANLPFDMGEVDAETEGRALRYPEWDHYKQLYRKDWAVVEEVEAWRPDGEREDMDEVITTTSRELQRQLSSLGVDHEMHRRQKDGADLDEGRLLDVAIGLASGFTPPSLDVYRASRRTRRDLAVAIALDISGSTAEANSEGRSVFDRQLGVAYQMGRTLTRLGDSVALFGFHSWGRNLVRSVRLKGPEEAWSGRVAERFSRLEPYGYTRTGTAIRHATRMLTENMRLPNRLFILITDGIAYDQDYEAAYAEADARKALEEAADKGTACVCLCIGGSSSRDKLEAVFGSANLLMVDEPEQVTPRIRQVCMTALMRVSKPRRGKGKGKEKGKVA